MIDLSQIEFSPLGILALLIAIALCVAVVLFRHYYQPKEIEPEAPLEPEISPVGESRSEQLYNISFAFLHRHMDVSPNDLASDEVACVESVEEVYRACTGEYISGFSYPLLSTSRLLLTLQAHPRFKEVFSPQRGAIIVNATGSGNNKIRGHAGICGNDWVMANNSYTGLWGADYTYKQWENRFVKFGGMRTFYYLPF